MAVGVLGQLRLDLGAYIGGPRAAGVEAAAARRIDRVRRLAGHERPLAGAILAGSGIGIAPSNAEVYGWIGLS